MDNNWLLTCGMSTADSFTGEKEDIAMNKNLLIVGAGIYGVFANEIA